LPKYFAKVKFALGRGYLASGDVSYSQTYPQILWVRKNPFQANVLTE